VRGFFDRLALSALYTLQPETAHHCVLYALEHGLVGRRAEPDDPILKTNVFGLEFSNPIGLAAGFDKDARVIDAMLDLGFGFVEAGTVTPKPQPGNPKPRLFRLSEDLAVINRLGFNSGGVEAFAQRLAERRKRAHPAGIVGANVGKNRDTVDGAADYVKGIEAVCGLSDYLVVNISSPNTPGLRSLQARAPIEDLLTRVLAARDRATPDPKRRPPLLAKVGPDLSEAQLEDIAEVALVTKLDGLIIGNTTIERPFSLKSRDKAQAGGLSGVPLMAPATACLASLYRLTGGRIPLIGCGGVRTGADAYAKLRAGASLVQVYSALVFEGPGLANRIKAELARILRAEGFRSAADAAGKDRC
jgi:dihydroorotate dehydrogenase